MDDKFTATRNDYNGKTVATMTIRKTWRDDHAEEIVIEFTDGTKLNLSAYTESGCSECDPDGANLTYINMH